MFKYRRIPLAVQEDLLRSGLPRSVAFRGAFDKTGNYALESQENSETVAMAILSAFRQYGPLLDLHLTEVFVYETKVIRQALEELQNKLKIQYEEQFDARSCAVQIAGANWRAGMTFLPEPMDLQPFLWPNPQRPRTIILGASGAIGFFLKREESAGESRISFGDPTAAIDRLMARQGLTSVRSTSRSLRTVTRVLLC